MGLIPEEVIAQVIDRCDIVEVVSSYVPLKRAGRNFKTNCPFHNEKTPSFVVNPDKQIFHCFGCGVGGNVISFVMKQDHMNFPEAVRHLAAKVNIDVPDTGGKVSGQEKSLRQQILAINALAAEYFHKNLLAGSDAGSKEARAYLKSRNIGLETVKTFQLGFALDSWDALMVHLKSKDISLSLMEKAGLIIPRDSKEGYYDRFRNRIVFSIFDARNHCRAFGARSLEKDVTAKYINSPETPVYTKGHYLYGLDVAKEAVAEQDSVVIVEGYTDCIIPYQAGVCNVVASLGTALTVEQVRLIRRYTKNVIMLFDMDPAGESAMMRSLDMLIEEGMSVKVAGLSKDEDPDSFICKYGVDSFRDRLTFAKPVFDYKLGILKNRFDATSIEGKAKIASEMLPTIQKFGNAVIRAGYMNRLSRALMVPEEALASEMSKLGSSRRSSGMNEEGPRPKAAFGQHRMVEKNLLKLLLLDESLIAATKASSDIDDFQDERIRGVIAKIFELYDEGKKVDAPILMNCFEDQAVHQMISNITADSEFVVSDIKKMHHDCLNRLKTDRLKWKRQTILQQIHEAEMAGDHGMLEDLKKQFNQLVTSQDGEKK